MSVDPELCNFISLDSDLESEDGWKGEETAADRTVPSFSTTRQNLPATFEECLAQVLEVFPDVSYDHVRKIWDKKTSTFDPSFIARSVQQSVIEDLLDGGAYPKERDRIRELKRKRDSPEAEAAKWRYKDLRSNPLEYAEVARAALCERFNTVPTRFIGEVFREHPNYYEAFFAIDKAEKTLDSGTHKPFVKLKHRRNSVVVPGQLMRSLEENGHDFDSLKDEIRAAESRWNKEKDKIRQAKEAAEAKEAQEEEHRRNGEVMTCACCFSDDVPISTITHCSANEPHFFCFDCARRNAENDIGSQKYGLCCMDQSRCESTFSREQRMRFLDAASVEKLESLQQLDEIRRADMENLEHCPFCDYAAICPPPEVNKEFNCQNPDCGEVSCRFCKHKTHIPLSCEEFKRENGVSQRREIEEARTEALLRTCKKCGVRILKEDGCNKVVCTSCYAVLCDYCGQDISKAKYEHFDGGFRGQAENKGKCPLYDGSVRRKEDQIERAGRAAMDKVRREYPELSEEDLRIKFSSTVEKPQLRGSQMELVFQPGAAMNGVLPQAPDPLEMALPVEHRVEEARNHRFAQHRQLLQQRAQEYALRGRERMLRRNIEQQQRQQQAQQQAQQAAMLQRTQQLQAQNMQMREAIRQRTEVLRNQNEQLFAALNQRAMQNVAGNAQAAHQMQTSGGEAVQQPPEQAKRRRHHERPRHHSPQQPGVAADSAKAKGGQTSPEAQSSNLTSQQASSDQNQPLQGINGQTPPAGTLPDPFANNGYLNQPLWWGQPDMVHYPMQPATFGGAQQHPPGPYNFMPMAMNMPILGHPAVHHDPRFGVDPFNNPRYHAPAALGPVFPPNAPLDAATFADMANHGTNGIQHHRLAWHPQQGQRMTIDPRSIRPHPNPYAAAPIPDRSAQSPPSHQGL